MANASFADPLQQLLPLDQRDLANLTALAKKYSHPVKTINHISHRVLKNTGKSGITPIKPKPHAQHRIATPLLTPSSIPSRLLEQYQTRRFYGFSTEELQALGAITGLDTSAGGSTLEDVIHPLFAQEKWERSDSMGLDIGPVPIRGGVDGFWVAENPVVWNALKPSIYLASHLITNASVYPWWDALFFGEIRDIPSFRLERGDRSKNLKSFHARPLHIREDVRERERVDAQFRIATEKIRFRLWSGYSKTSTGLAVEEGWSWGGTDWGAFSNHVTVNIALEMVQPLLNKQLTAAERMASQFCIATTLVHEVTHAIWKLKQDSDTDSILGELSIEPYFEDEVLAELGWSLEDKLWGGAPLDILHNDYSRGGPGLAKAGFFKTNWFVDRHRDNTSAPCLAHVVPLHPEKDPYRRHDYYPVSTSWVKSLFDCGLWESQVQKYNASAIKMQPCHIGSSANYKYRISQHEKLTHYSRNFIGTTVLAVDLGTTVAKQEMVRAEMVRQKHANDTLGRMRSIVPIMPVINEPSDGPDPPEPSYTCARWDAIAQYLFDHRDPDDLCLDTLDFPMPEQTLYKNVYYNGKGMPGITPDEFRDFLRVCHQRKLLFSYTPFPAGGTLCRLPTGWPQKKNFEFLRKKRADPRQVGMLDTLVQDHFFQETLYIENGEYRDIDYERLRVIAQRNSTIEIRFGEMEHLVTYLALGRFITLGPRGCARMIWPILQSWRDKHSTSFAQKMLDTHYVMAQDAIDQEARLKQQEKKEQHSKKQWAQNDSGVADLSALSIGLQQEEVKNDPKTTEAQDDSGIADLSAMDPENSTGN